jgi:Protein of unknown function (DUF3551)
MNLTAGSSYLVEEKRSYTMRRIIFFLAAVAVALLGVAPAEATRARYCMQGPTSPGLSNCTFTSMAQCRATASGRRGMRCIANPFYKRPAG